MKRQTLFSTLINDSIKNNWNCNCIRDAQAHSISYGEFGNSLLAFHQFLSSKKTLPNEKIILIASNSIEWCIIYLGAITYGAVIVPISPELPTEHICNLIKHSEAKIALVSEDIKSKADSIKRLVSVYSLSDERIMKNDYTISADTFSLPELPNDTFSIISYTSGTNDDPKGVMLNLASILGNLKFAHRNFPLQAKDHLVATMPFTHSFGSLYEFLYPFSIGASIFLLHKKPTPKTIKETFNAVRPKMFFTVPLVIEKIFQEAIANTFEIESLDLDNEKANYRERFMQFFSPECETIIIGGAKLDPNIEEVLSRIQVPFSCGYGMTECGPTISWNKPTNAKLHSVGQPVDGMLCKVINDTNGIGEILVKGNNLMLGYFKNSRSTAEAIDEEGWLHTGDLGYIDSDGYIFLEGRRQNVILKNNGINIYIQDIENTIKRNCPKIEDCVVFERGGRIIAKVILSSKNINTANLLNEINQHIPKYASISQIETEVGPILRNSKNEIFRKLYK